VNIKENTKELIFPKIIKERISKARYAALKTDNTERSMKMEERLTASVVSSPRFVESIIFNHACSHIHKYVLRANLWHGRSYPDAI